MKRVIYLFAVFAIAACGRVENTEPKSLVVEPEVDSCATELNEVLTPCCATKKDKNDEDCGN